MENLDFRTYLTRALCIRQEKNSGYSVRAFARDLGLSAQTLDKILKGRIGISSAVAEKVADKLQLKKCEKEIFITMVEAKHHRTRAVREAAILKLGKLLNDQSFQKLEGDDVSVMGQWYNIGCYMLVDLDCFKKDHKWVAQRLGITEEQSQQAYDLLFSMGLLREEADGRWVRDSAKFSATSEAPSKDLQEYYRQLWKVAEPSLMAERTQLRNFSASVLSVGYDDLEFVKNEIDAFHKSLISKISLRPGKAERLYGITLQMFPVDRQEGA